MSAVDEEYRGVGRNLQQFCDSVFPLYQEVCQVLKRTAALSEFIERATPVRNHAIGSAQGFLDPEHRWISGLFRLCIFARRFP
jgi:hypothetical protein